MDWLKKQPFYEDTVILVTGDHLSMAEEYISSTYEKSYDRTVFNALIHSEAWFEEETKKNKNRIFTSFDWYPTILNALGAKVEGDRLGFGVSLFSDKKTVAEEIGLKKFDQELRKQSEYYNREIVR